LQLEESFRGLEVGIFKSLVVRIGTCSKSRGIDLVTAINCAPLVQVLMVRTETMTVGHKWDFAVMHCTTRVPNGITITNSRLNFRYGM
jgi:hypothetical protein